MVNLDNRCRLHHYLKVIVQGRIQDLIRGGAPDRDRPKTAILGPQFCRILVLEPHFWWSGGGAWAPGAPPGSTPVVSGGSRDKSFRCPPNRTQFFRFCIHFRQKAPASEVHALSPKQRLTPPPQTGNPGYFPDSPS